MAKTVRPQKPPESIDNLLPPGEDLPDMVDSESLLALRESLDIEEGAESTVHVYRVDVDGQTRTDNKIWEGDAADYSLGSLAKIYGSGQYRVKVYVRNAEGFKPIRYNRVQGWLLAPDDEARVQIAKRRAMNPPADTSASNAGELRDLVANMMTGFQAVVTQLLTAQAAKPQPDPFTMIQKLGEVMKTMAPAPVAAGPDFMSVLNMVKTFNDVTGVGKGVPEGASASETLMLEAARSLMPALAAGLQKPATSANPQQPPAIPAPEINEEDQEKIMMLQLKLKAANRAAARGVKPEDYAETVYDAFEEDDIRGVALDPEWFKFMVDAVPDCATHEAWYREVRELLLEMAVEDEILARDAAGNLTIPGEAVKTGETTEQAGDGTSTTGNAGNNSSAVKP